jgi:hypothetical protein
MSKEYVNAEGYAESYENLCVALSRTISATTANAIDALRGKEVTGCMNYVLFKKLAAFLSSHLASGRPDLPRWRLHMRL